ncbi:glycosyltransferase family 2 protein [Solilutibacter pythonis]|uniref:glycosyltransferase family 2 protein n=1 Tax=Solilutibacter pythonis TaxID=2483112 RepID=UPI001FE54C00|nr:glycosyltransferase family 2 protein [Lysobacter pythonis]
MPGHIAGRIDAGRVVAVAVTYRPDLPVLTELLERLRPQLGAMVLVDNGSGDAAVAGLRALALRFEADLIVNAENLGVGAALNQGIAWARTCEADAVLLMDQDSLPATDMLVRLLEAWRVASSSAKVAAVGPRAVDVRNGDSAPFVRVGFPLNRKIVTREAVPLACDFLITSGSLIPIGVLDEVGDMDASLFIDSVDLEWCFRARAAGFSCFGAGNAEMGHRIGDGIRRLAFGSSFVHSPVRLYYMMRNRVLLYRRPTTPGVWIGQDIPRAIFKLLRFSALVAPRGRNCAAMLAGIRDGLRGRAGPRDAA